MAEVFYTWSMKTTFKEEMISWTYTISYTNYLKIVVHLTRLEISFSLQLFEGISVEKTSYDILKLTKLISVMVIEETLDLG